MAIGHPRKLVVCLFIFICLRTAASVIDFRNTNNPQRFRIQVAANYWQSSASFSCIHGDSGEEKLPPNKKQPKVPYSKRTEEEVETMRKRYKALTSYSHPIQIMQCKPQSPSRGGLRAANTRVSGISKPSASTAASLKLTRSTLNHSELHCIHRTMSLSETLVNT